MVDLPEAERPVNQTVAPFCLRRSVRSSRVRPACHVMLLSHCVRICECKRECVLLSLQRPMAGSLEGHGKTR